MAKSGSWRYMLNDVTGWTSFLTGVSPNTNEPLHFFPEYRLLFSLFHFIFILMLRGVISKSYPRHDASYFLLTHSCRLWCPLAAKLISLFLYSFFCPDLGGFVLPSQRSENGPRQLVSRKHHPQQKWILEDHGLWLQHLLHQPLGSWGLSLRQDTLLSGSVFSCPAMLSHLWPERPLWSSVAQVCVQRVGAQSASAVPPQPWVPGPWIHPVRQLWLRLWHVLARRGYACRLQRGQARVPSQQARHF